MGPVNSARDPLEKHETLFSKKKKEKKERNFKEKGKNELIKKARQEKYLMRKKIMWKLLIR